MKLILCVLMVLSVSLSKAQFEFATIFIGTTDSTCKVYLDSLNHLKKNQAYKIKQSANKYGNLMLTVEYSLLDEKYYSCLGNSLTFQRVNGTEVCIRQVIWGHPDYAMPNLNYIKDNFSFVSENKWEMKNYGNTALKLVAIYKKVSIERYYIEYTLEE